MKVLVLSNLYPPDVIGGYEIKCVEAVEALEAHGHEVLVLTSVPRWPVETPANVRRLLTLTDVYDVVGNARSSTVTRWLDHSRANFVSADNVYRLAAVVDEFKPDVAYLWNLVGLGGLGVVAAVQYLGVPWVWQLFDTVPRVLCEFEGSVVPPVAAEFNRTIEGRFLACSQGLVDEMDTSGIHLAARTELVPMWIAGDTPPPRQDYYSGGHLRVIFAGRVTADKGISIIIESAARLVREGYVNFSIDIFGHVNAAELYLKGLVHEQGLEGVVSFMGLRPASVFADLYPQYDVFAFPTWSHEPFAFAPLEAAAYGCVPVFTADCGNAEWFVHDVDCLKSLRSTDAFTTQLRRVLDGEVDLRAIGTRAETTVWEDFSRDHAMEKVESVLDDAAASGGSRSGTSAEAYHLAVIAEKVLSTMLKEAS